MRITYRTLAKLIERMSDEQKDCDVTAKIETCGCYEIYTADLYINDGKVDDILDDKHPYLLVIMMEDDPSIRLDNIEQICQYIGLNPQL